MKPKTKLQHTIIGLLPSLQPITSEQIKYAENKLFKPYFRKVRNTIHCLECTHSSKEKNDKITKTICKGCSKKLIRTDKNPHQKFIEETYYHAILSTVDNFQVIRFFTTKKSMIIKCKPTFFTSEVMQLWIDESGRITTLSLKVQAMSRYYDSWVYNSNIELRQNSIRSNITPQLIHTKRKILPIIKRNGFKGKFYNFAPQTLFRLILGDNQAETLLKLNQLSALKYLYKREINFDEWTSLKTCFKNNYIVSDFSIYADYVALLIHYKKDIRNPKFACPSNLLYAHDKLVKKRRQDRRKEEIEQLKKSIKSLQKEYTKAKRQFFKLSFSDGEILIKTISRISDFHKIGIEQNHCIFENEYWERESSLIMVALQKNKPIETIEISLDNFEILQARGLNNTPSKYNAKIIQIVEKNIPEIRKIASKKVA